MNGVTAISGRAAQRLLEQLQIRPVLVDVGASDLPPQIWDRIAPQSIYVAFDPDQRDTHELSGGRFQRSILVNEAITADERAAGVPFYLTRAPHCSSTLRPDTAALESYMFAPLFAVEREVTVRAVPLGQVIARLDLPGIDWLKLDTQGTDLQIFNSLSADVRDHVLALDVEPGLIDAYIGEDLFVDSHKSLVGQGFWLSNMRVRGAARIGQGTLGGALAEGSGLSPGALERTLRRSPGWCEARYLRTVEWLDAGDFAARDYALHWVFALLDDQLGFALDIGAAYRRRFGGGELAAFLQSHPLRYIRNGGHIRLAALAGWIIDALAQRARKFRYTRS
jgi:FkbM family methyltransferase